MQKVSANLRNLIDTVELSVGDLLPFFASLVKSGKLSEEQLFIVEQLQHASLSATDATLLLVEADRVWEAEIVLRTCIEASLKLMFLLLLGADTDTNFREYAEDLPDMGQLRSHERAEQLCSIHSDLPDAELRPFKDLFLTSDVLSGLRRKFPRQVRQALEQKWSFSELVLALSRSSEAAYEPLPSMLMAYWSANQVTHASFEGIMLAVERQRREPSRRDTAHEAHKVRVVSDCYVFAQMRTFSALRFSGADMTDFRKRMQVHLNAQAACTTAHTDWRRAEYG